MDQKHRILINSVTFLCKNTYSAHFTNKEIGHRGEKTMLLVNTRASTDPACLPPEHLTILTIPWQHTHK